MRKRGRIYDLLYKGFLPVYIRKHKSGSKTFYLKQNSLTNKPWANVKGLYWQLREKPKESWKRVPERAYTGWVGIKRNGYWYFMKREEMFRKMKYLKRKFTGQVKNLYV